MLLHAKDAAEQVRDEEKKPCCAALKKRRNLQYLPVWTRFTWGLFFPEEGTFFLQEKLKSKFHLLITNKPTKRAVNVLLETWERHALCCPSHPLLPHRRWGTWLSPLLSSCTHLWQRERSTPPVNARRGARIPQRWTPSRPHWAYSVNWLCACVLLKSRLNQQLAIRNDEAECPLYVAFHSQSNTYGRFKCTW